MYNNFNAFHITYIPGMQHPPATHTTISMTHDFPSTNLTEKRSKQNGFAPLSTTTIPTANHCAKACNPIHSQQTTDLIQKQQSDAAATELQLESATTFQFTSPTATFKRKKQQQTQKQQQQQQQFEHQFHNNNNNCGGNQTVAATVINNSLATEVSQPKSKSPNRNSAENGNVQHTATVTTSIILNGIGVAATTKATNATKAITVDDILAIGSSGVVGAHNNTTTTTKPTTSIRTPRNRTLPRIATTTTTPRTAYAADNLDLVGSHTGKAPLNGHNKRQRATAKVKQSPQQHQQQQQRQPALQQHALPKRMTAGAAGGSSSASGSGNNSNHSSSNNNNNNNNSNTLHKENSALMDSLGAHLELVGWRKKCLYGLLVLLMLLIITNLVLTLWILKVMEFTTVSKPNIRQTHSHTHTLTYIHTYTLCCCLQRIMLICSCHIFRLKGDCCHTPVRLNSTPIGLNRPVDIRHVVLCSSVCVRACVCMHKSLCIFASLTSTIVVN